MFDGFPRDGIAFLTDLAAHNDRDWFGANKQRYEAGLVEPGKALVTDLGERLRAIRPTLQAEPRVGGSIFRIHRDTRFSTDKTPYKTHFDLWFWEGDAKGWDTPGFFHRVGADRVIVGVGMHEFSPERLARFRADVAGPRGDALEAILAKLPGYAVGGQHYKRVPAGFPADHPRAGLLRHNALHATWEGPPPAELYDRRWVDVCEAHFRALLPLHRWLRDEA